MTDQSLSISFSNSSTDTILDPYWLNMEIVKDEEVDGMTMEQAASVIDALYGISVCGESPDPYNLDGKQEVNNEPSQEDFNTAIRDVIVDANGVFSMPDTCEMSSYNIAGEEGAYDVEIKVFRSHPGTEIYKLRLSNGTASYPRKITERVFHTLEVEETTSYTVDNPIQGRPVIAWVGVNGPDLHITGNTIWWEGKFTGTLQAEFETEYDLIEIHVHGEPTNSQIIEGTLPEGYTGEGWYSGEEDASEITDIQNIQCSVLAFYHYQFEELILNRPEEDSSVSGQEKDDICSALDSNYGYSNTHIGGDDDSPEPYSYDTNCFDECEGNCSDTEYEACAAACYERCTRWCEQEQEVTKICDCSHNETNWINTYRVVCPSDKRTGDKLPDRDPEVNYIKCNDTNEEVNDPAFYEKTCCVPWPFTDRPMPRCQIIYSAYGGSGAISDSLKAQYDARYESVSYIGVGPEDGICGEQSVEQIITQKNCCLDAPDVFIPPGSNPSVLADYSSAIIIASGGTSPYTWNTNGGGDGGNDEAFFKDNGAHVNRTVTADSSVVLYTEDVCGTITIDITDACGMTADYQIRSAGGKWVYAWARTFTHDLWSPDLDPALKTCEYNGDDHSDPGSDNAEIEYSIITDARNSTWETRTLTGGYRFTERGSVYASVDTIDKFYYGDGTDCENLIDNGIKRADQDAAVWNTNVWPPCGSIPSGLVDNSCSVYGDRVEWICYECCEKIDDITLIYKQHYGPVNCGSAYTYTGAQIIYRKWERWEC